MHIYYLCQANKLYFAINFSGHLLLKGVFHSPVRLVTLMTGSCTLQVGMPEPVQSVTAKITGQTEQQRFHVPMGTAWYFTAPVTSAWSVLSWA